MDAPKPIGYWLMHLHHLLERQFDVTLGDLGLARRHWQVLHTLSRGAAPRGELADAVAPFLCEGEPGLAELLDGPDGLTARGWTRADGHTVELTASGRAVHAQAADRIARSRAVVLGELTPEQYQQTVRNLSVMAANVEADLAAGADAVR
ncbi:MarR family winged helix-turn-helix transcriptional regulator [Streptomyces spirodelae]|uniref:MarR family transcriptional regulator n=1 Tax=Streptomyces spirodelae TaxID=2812904 RepID=A0ABS3WLT6_9ACTN|nr:MarR family transcriptional regulator [Streptomyces spirodelae]MBO8184084.1 MarR family transcriptional regulator [Streptomyces spirodelae]